MSLTAISCGFASGADADRVWAHRVDLAIGNEECDAEPMPAIDASHYSGPLIDTHLHIPHLPDSRPRLDELSGERMEPDNFGLPESQFPLLGVNTSMASITCTLRHEGTHGAFAFFPVFEHISEPSLEVARRTLETNSDIFYPLINTPGEGDTPSVDNETLKEMLAVYPGLFDGYGEISLHGDSGRGFEPDSQTMTKIFSTASSEGLAVYLHPAPDQFDNLSQMLVDFPEVNFIVHGEQIENEIDRLMELHPNIFFTVNDLYGDQYLLHSGETAESFLAKISDYENLLKKDLATWKKRIETHPDQFLWGTDRGGIAVWTFDLEVGRALSDYARAFISKLDPDVQERFAYRNALRIMGETEIRAD